MAVVFKLQSQNVAYDRDQFTATAVYAVYDDAGALLTTQNIISSAGLTTVLGAAGTSGSALNSFGTYLNGTGTGTSSYSKLNYSGYTLANADGGAAWTLTVNFGSAQSSYVPTAVAKDIVPENQPGFTAVEMDISAAIVPTFRVDNYSLPAGAAISNPGETDIGGKPVDQAGEPIDAFVSTLRFTLRNVMNGRPSSTLLGNLASQTNTRNSAGVTIAGFTCPAGTLLFTGAQISRVGPNAYEITYSMAYDKDYHLRQVAKVDSTKQVVMGILSGGSLTTTAATLDADPNAQRYAGVVMWKQPFPGTSDFSGLVSWLP